MVHILCSHPIKRTLVQLTAISFLKSRAGRFERLHVSLYATMAPSSLWPDASRDDGARLFWFLEMNI